MSVIPRTGLGIFRTFWSPEDLENLEQLIPLERHILLGIKFGFLAFEYRSQASELCHDTAHSPAINRLCVMFGSHEQFRGTIPDSNDHLVPSKKRLKRLVYKTGKAEITNLDYPTRSDQDVGGFEVTV